MNASSSRTCNITDISDEILIEIILYLNATERVPLGISCRRFHSLVFEDRELLRELDFSKDPQLTSASDIHRYFYNENGNKYILKVNLKNVECIRPDVMLFNNIIKAVNLVDINIHGIIIRDRWLLRDFLRPLPNVRRLAIDWPKGEFSAVCNPYCEYLQERFGKLTYLSVRLPAASDILDFYQALQCCKELKELHITAMSFEIQYNQTIIGLELNNLEIIAYYGPRLGGVAESMISAILNPEEWTHFELWDPLTHLEGFYLERNVEVCEQMLESISLKRLSYNYPAFASKLGGFVVSVCLLEKMMEINNENLQGKFCCLSPTNSKIEGQISLPSVCHAARQWILKIKEAKLRLVDACSLNRENERLLRDPRYPISYLGIFHNMEPECDMHMVVSAFPSLTELALSNITKLERTNPKKTMLLRGRAKKSDIAALESDELPNSNSSFSKLVTGTPNMKQLTIIANTSQLGYDEDQTWDLASLPLIAGWKNLTILRLWHIPITDGKFLMEIGKQCKQLEHLDLYNLGPLHTCCYAKDLLRMLMHCSNLREFSLKQKNIGQLSEMFFLLANNKKIRSIRVMDNSDRKITVDLRPSIEQLLYRCPELTTFACSNTGTSKVESDQLVATLERLKRRLNRPTLKYEVVDYGCERNTTGRVSPPLCILC